MTDARLAELRAQLELDFYGAIRAYEVWRAAAPDELLPAELAPLERHLRLGTRQLIRARKIFLQRGDSGESLIDELFGKRAYAKIEAHVANALAIDPDCGPALYTAAQLARVRGDAARAIALLDQAAAVEPGLTHVHYLRAALAAQQGDKPAVLASLGRAITLDRKQGGTYRFHDRARGDPDFAAMAGDADVAALCDPLPADPAVRGLCEAMRRGDYGRAYRDGAALLAAGDAPLAAFDAVAEALRAIVSEVAEHGEEQLETMGAGEHEVAFYEGERVRIGEQRAARFGEAAESEEFRRFREMR